MRLFINKLIFICSTFIKVIIPPMYSLERLEKHCKKHIYKNPESYQARSFLAGIYSFYEKNEEAAKEYFKLQKLAPLTDKDKLNFGEIMFRLQNYDGVIEEMADTIDKFPRNKNMNWYLGISYMKKLEYQKAITYLEKVISLGTERYEDYWHLGFCYDKIGNLEGAKEKYLKAISINPNSEELKINLTSVEERLSRS